jgi:hypothetical protein
VSRALLLRPPDVYVKETGTPIGRAVFASRAFEESEIVELCPVVLFTFPQYDLPIEIGTRLFAWQSLGGIDGEHAFALGYGNLYNHDNPASMRYEADESGLLLRFTANRLIAADEELTINYNATGGGAECHDDNWFDLNNIARIAR